ncbi:MAG: glycosyltransferase family A protein [Carboxydocellales bacterium]
MPWLITPGNWLTGLDVLWFIPLVLVFGLGLKIAGLKTKLPPITIILMVRNLENCIEGLVRCIFALENRSRRTLQLIVVDNRSDDQTPLIVSRLSAKFLGMSLLNSHTNTWQEQPVAIARNYARYPLVMYLNLKPPVNFLRVTAQIEGYLRQLGDGMEGPPPISPGDPCLEWVRWKI